VVDEVKESDLRLSRRGYFNETKSVSIYLLKHLRNDSNYEVGGVFKIYKYSTVSSIVERIKLEMGRTKNLKNVLKN
jgi:chromosomal replication initiation ATPase DnaA